MAFIAERALTPIQINAIKKLATLKSDALAQKLSIVCTDREFSEGRFPVLDHIDLLDHGRLIVERERIAPPRPTLDEVRRYLAGRPLSNWREAAQVFAQAHVLVPSDRKAYLRALLYPGRFWYSWTTGGIGSNDEGVRLLKNSEPVGLDLGLIERALECRQAAEDPDVLFSERKRLLEQVDACSRLIRETAS